MAKRTKKKPSQNRISASKSKPKDFPKKSFFSIFLSNLSLPLLLALTTFIIYWPSLASDFIYDGRFEILEEGFITNFSNLPAVLSLKVLGMNLMLGSRPGSLLYLMLIAAVWGKHPFGYHLCSNLLHAANVALLFIFLLRLAKAEITGLARNGIRRIQLAIAAVTLIFALHPLAVEPVSAINYCSDLLVTFFTLLALLAATAFKPENFRIALLTGAIGTFCAFTAVTCKESGLAVALLLIVYWFLFRRNEAKKPWFWFLGGAMMVTAAFLAARFAFAPTASEPAPTYLGGSFFQVFLIQPQLWIFMMGKLFWPTRLSADYVLENVDGLPTSVALVILVLVVALQVRLASQSRIGAMGVAVYWVGLITVSNFIPLFRILGDRFYYLPLVGVTMQLLALLLMILRWRDGFWAVLAPCLIALLPLTLLTLMREDVFADEFTLWSDTLQVSPLSASAHTNLGKAFLQKGQVDDAMAQFQKAMELVPNYADNHYNFGVALLQKGQLKEAIAQFQKALEIYQGLKALAQFSPSQLAALGLHVTHASPARLKRMASSLQASVVHGVVIVTLSKVAVQRRLLLCAVTARPTLALGDMLIVCVLPSCVQLTPSLDRKPVNEFPDRVTLTQ